MPGLRMLARTTALLLSVTVALAAHPVLAAPLLAQQGSESDDRVMVMIWTLVAVGVAMVALAIGYVYRRAAGIEKPPPVPILEPGQKITQD